MSALIVYNDTIKEITEYDKPLFGNFEFSELGRNKRKFTIQLDGEISLWSAIKPHLMSGDIEYEYDAEKNEGRIFVGGVRHVGNFKKL